MLIKLADPEWPRLADGVAVLVHFIHTLLERYNMSGMCQRLKRRIHSLAYRIGGPCRPGAERNLKLRLCGSPNGHIYRRPERAEEARLSSRRQIA